MNTFVSPYQTFWDEDVTETRFLSMQGAAAADVAILGAGMVGITLAEILKRAGKRVAVIDALHVGAQVTGRSTAKLTALHRLIYADLIRKHGEGTARLYAQANQGALEHVTGRVEHYGIDCALEHVPAFTHSESGAGLEKIREEVVAAQRVGLPVQYVDEAPAPFKIAGAARLDEQLQFHPQRYVRALAETIPGNGSMIFEMTRALDIEEGSPNRVVTDRGILTAQDVVIATNIPFPNRGFYFAKVYPRAHVVMAIRIGQATAPGGMFISTDSPSFSVRAFRAEESTVLIATGGGFRPGRGDVVQHYRALRAYVQSRFDVQEELCWWSNEDYDSMDRLPFVGRIARNARIYVATGFSAWGLSNGTAAAQILADRILGGTERNQLAEAFSARRWSPRASTRRFTLGNAHVARDFVQARLETLRARHSSELGFDEGGLVRHHGRVVAAYKDTAGALRTWSPRCPHMGCLLRWNGAEQTWDCPCHGSRFRRDGRLLHGPAVRDMKGYESS